MRKFSILIICFLVLFSRAASAASHGDSDDAPALQTAIQDCGVPAWVLGAPDPFTVRITSFVDGWTQFTTTEDPAFLTAYHFPGVEVEPALAHLPNLVGFWSIKNPDGSNRLRVNIGQFPPGGFFSGDYYATVTYEDFHVCHLRYRAGPPDNGYILPGLYPIWFGPAPLSKS